MIEGGNGVGTMATDPRALWLLRHGQSLGNVARDAAAGQEIETLDIADRDMDVPLSDLGRQQAIGVREVACGTG